MTFSEKKSRPHFFQGRVNSIDRLVLNANKKQGRVVYENSNHENIFLPTPRKIQMVAP